MYIRNHTWLSALAKCVSKHSLAATNFFLLQTKHLQKYFDYLKEKRLLFKLTGETIVHFAIEPYIKAVPTHSLHSKPIIDIGLMESTGQGFLEKHSRLMVKMLIVEINDFLSPLSWDPV